MVTLVRQMMWEGFKPVVGGCSSNVKQGKEHHWCGWVDLNTNALITGLTKHDDSDQSVKKAGRVM